LTLAIGAEDALHGSALDTSDRPDIIASLGGSAGGLNFKVAGVSHDDSGESGYAILGHIDAKFGSATLFAFGGYANDATDYVSPHDVNGSASSFGGGVTLAVSSATSITAQGLMGEIEGSNYSSYGLYLSHTIAKGLSIQPEVVFTDSDAHGQNTGAMLRIERDF